MKKLFSILLVCSTLIACSTVKKHKTLEQSKSDSTVQKKTDVVASKSTDSISNKQTIATDETVVNIEFEADTSTEKKAIKISVNKGNIEVDAGNRKIKAINATSKNNIDSSSKTTTATNENLLDKSTLNVVVKKENKAVVVEKKSTRSKIGISIAAITALMLIFLFIKKKKQVEELV